MKLYLIRHGATPGNLEKRYVGTTEESLLKETAVSLRKSRRQYPVPECVVTSPMKRCAETAALLFPGLEQEKEEDLRECDFGIFEYRNYQELSGEESYQRWIESGGTLPFPGGESREAFARRSQAAFRKKVRELCARGVKAASFVVHGGTIMAVMEAFCTEEKPYFDWQTGNAEGYCLEVDACAEEENRRFLKIEGKLPTAKEQLHVSGIEEHFVMQKNRKLQCGYTTGSCAAAAAKAAAWMLFRREPCRAVELTTPGGIRLLLETELPEFEEGRASCAVRKYGGDDPDATDGLLIFADVRVAKDGQTGDAAQVWIDGGEGVGRVTKEGLEQPVGAAAINRVPRQMIAQGVQEVCAHFGFHGVLEVTISVRGGAEAAKHTFNPHLGIQGGISILGTSGIVVPMSEQALLDSIRVEMKQKLQNKGPYLLITPGNYGEDFVRSQEQFRLLRPEDSMQCSNYIGETLDMAVELGAEAILFVAHIGKFIKVSGGVMNTHSAQADCRAELMAAQAMRAGAAPETVRRILDSNTTEEAVSLLRSTRDLDATVQETARRIHFHLQKRCGGALITEVVLFSSQYGYLGETQGAEALMQKIAAAKTGPSV